MITQDQRAFAKYAIGRLLSQLALATPSQQEFINQLAGVVPEVNAQDGVTRAEFTPAMWNDRIATVISDHFAEEFAATKLKTA